MTKIVSQKQVDANRRNAKKSTGPKTKSGKARASKNALKHGLLAKDVVVEAFGKAERQEDFDALLADLCKELQPQGLIEETFVERIATCYWRLRRAQRFEVGAILSATETPDPEVPTPGQVQDQLDDALKALANQRRLVELLEKAADQLTPEESVELERLIDDSLGGSAFAKSLLDPPNRNKVLKRVVHSQIPEQEVEIQRLRAELEDAKRNDALRKQRSPLTDSLPARDPLLRVVRYETMLDRQIHRALAALARIRNLSLRGTPRRNN